MTNHDDLRRAAEAATPDEWVWTGLYVEADGVAVCNPLSGRCVRNGKYIAAANPKRILALLDDLAAKDAEIARLREALKLHTRDGNQHYHGCEKLLRAPNVEAACNCGVAALGSAKSSDAAELASVRWPDLRVAEVQSMRKNCNEYGSALQRFASRTGCPAGSDVVQWLDKMAEELEALKLKEGAE